MTNFSKFYLIDFLKKVLAKAKNTNFFERKIGITRPSNGTRIALETRTGSSSSWKTYSVTAPVSGWYMLECKNGTSGQTRASYVAANNVEIRNAIYSTGRDFWSGPVWAQKGQTVSYGFVYCATVTLYYVAAYEQ